MGERDKICGGVEDEKCQDRSFLTSEERGVLISEFENMVFENVKSVLVSSFQVVLIRGGSTLP